ncbi:MAG: outer membrane protein assembly factor BamD [Bacteroidota bacterium]
MIILLSSSCKNEFERLRASGDQEQLYTKAFEYYENEDYVKAQALFELVINGLRGKVEAEKVYFYYAYTHFYLNKFILSSYYFKNFSNTFPNSQYREEADFMNAYSYYKLSPNFRLEQSNTEKAVESMQLFVNTFPNSKRVPECNKLIDEMRKKMERKAFNEAVLYYDLKQYQSANRSFENLLKDYPETNDAERVRFMITKASFLLAENSIYEKREERYQQALKNSSSFLERYPESSYKKEVSSIYNKSNNQLKSFKNE